MPAEPYHSKAQSDAIAASPAGDLMKLNDLILVSVDDHVIEPPNAFARHMPAGFKGREPIVQQRNGRDIWVFEDRATGYMGLNSVVGRPKEEYGMEPL
ncbi:MAG TPA: hypothetical protein VK580_14565, partial [Steroidobacteraceae bacterium]|nr:hypothetical protein [Steroidobacteraceae bacterium]